MRIDFLCPTCSAPIRIDPALDGAAATCPTCSRRHTLQISETLYPTGVIDRCPACGNDELYIQKDFNRTLGICLVGIIIIASIIVVATTHSTIHGFLVLLVGALLDALLYILLPGVTVCYACHAQIREVTKHPDHQAFYIGKEEKYRAIRRNNAK
ncbi:MAG: hypothetical protein HY709_11960 [Candidatus Latescibacteria bacterium]|nr:hypothetical protein [Candidatus Latescibacterota bacterium]